MITAGVVHLLKCPTGWVGEPHPTPVRQSYVILQGAMGCTTSDGFEFTACVGDSGILEDTWGKGHKSWVASDEDAVLLMVTLPEPT